MKKNILMILFLANFANSADVFDLSKEEYNYFKENPKDALIQFENKFIKQSNTQIIVSEKKEQEKNSKLDKSEVLNSLEYEKLIALNELNVENLLKNIDELLSKTNLNYDINDISFVLRQISKKEFDEFEAKIYIEQIIEMIKG